MKLRNLASIPILGLLPVLLLPMAACATDQTQEPPTEAPAQVAVADPTSTPPPSPTTTKAPPPTPQPTATPEPTSTPTPSPTPTPPISADEYLKLGSSLFEQGDYDGSMAAFDQAITQDPWSMTQAFFLHQEARRARDARQPLGDLDAQIAELDLAIAENPEYAEACYRRGKLKYARAILSGETVEQRPLFEDDSGVNVIGGTITVDSLNLADAIADFDAAIAIDPEYATAYHMRGLAHHLQSLEYIGIALVDYSAEDLQQAINDYDQAIALDPDLSVAYRDRGVAIAHRYWLAEEPGSDPAGELEQAIGDLTVALESNPDSAELYINRAFVRTIVGGRLDEDDNSILDLAQAIFDDASKAAELEPENPWPYLFRILAYSLAEDAPMGEDLVDEWEPIVEQDLETFEGLVDHLTMQYDVADLYSRILTLSEEPAIEPEISAAEAFGQFETGRYVSPDGRIVLAIPDLLQPNAIMVDELTASGHLIVWFEDDLARWFSFQAHPGSPEDVPLIDWAQVNIIEHLDAQEVSEIEGQSGPLVIVEYRLAEPEGSCAMAVSHFDEVYYSAEYCLLDHYMGEEQEIGGIRLFANSAYEPVDELLLQFLQGVELNGQPLLAPS